MSTHRVHKYGWVMTQALGCMRALPRQWLQLYLQLLCGRCVAGCREETLRNISVHAARPRDRNVAETPSTSVHVLKRRSSGVGFWITLARMWLCDACSSEFMCMMNNQIRAPPMSISSIHLVMGNFASHVLMRRPACKEASANCEGASSSRANAPAYRWSSQLELVSRVFGRHRWEAPAKNTQEQS